MGIAVTWDDGESSPTTYTVSDEVLESLDQFRQTLVKLDPVSQALVARYPTAKEMIVGVFIEQLAMPAVTAFPPASVATAKANLESALTALAVAQAAAVGIVS